MVSIITINYNNWQDTCELIASLKQHETSPYEIIVVDNASQGDDVEQIRQNFPEVKLVESKINLGFAGGNNLGCQYAVGEYFFFLNNDMIVKTPILEPMVRRLQNHSYAGVSPCIVYLYKSDWIQYYGYKDLSSITLRHTSESFDPARREHFMKPGDTEVLHGGAMMVRRDVIEKVGMMTDIYFLFYEEFDWSRRLREAGYKLFYEPASVVYHKEGRSIKPQTSLREYYLARSRMIYARRNCIGWRKPLSCIYQIFFALPKKTLLCLYHRRFDLMVANWRGALSGLFCKVK